MKPAPPITREEIVSHFRCPCGCKLTLGRTAYNHEQRLIALLGERPQFVALTVSAERIARREAAEPTEDGLCRFCGSTYALPVFLAVFLKTHRAPWPECDACRRAA